MSSPPSVIAPEKSALIKACVDATERILRDQLEMHRTLLQCIARKKHAIRTADIAGVTRICGEENAIVQRLAETEKQRLALLGRMTQFVNPGADRPLAVTELAEHAPEPQRSRIIALAVQLREALQQVQKESSVVRAAAETLSRHMTGIMQTVHAALNRTRVYGHRGRISTATQFPAVVDIKS